LCIRDRAMTSTPIPRGIRWTAAPGQIWKTLTWCGSRGWRGCGPWRQRWAQGMCSSCRVAGGTMCSRSLKIRSPSLPWWFQGGFLHLHIGVARIRERTICPSRPHAMLFFGEVLPSNEYDWVCHLTRDDAQSTGSHHFWHFDDKRLTFHGKPVNQSKNLSCPATFLFKHLQTQHYGSHFFQKQKQSIEHRSKHILRLYIYNIKFTLLMYLFNNLFVCLFIYLNHWSQAGELLVLSELLRWPTFGSPKLPAAAAALPRAGASAAAAAGQGRATWSIWDHPTDVGGGSEGSEGWSTGNWASDFL
jgi:hypothetical protein